MNNKVEDIVRKIRIKDDQVWDHHRGGWKYVTKTIHDKFCCDSGIDFISVTEDYIIKGNVLDKPWIGFMHQVPEHEYFFYPDLKRFMKLPAWKKSLINCKGLFTLTKYQKEWLNNQNLQVPIENLTYIAEITETLFDLGSFLSNDDKCIVSIGGYLRNFQAIYDIKVEKYKKRLIIPDYIKEQWDSTEDLTVSSTINDSEYDDLLSKNIVFLNLKDAPANTTITECIVRNTPVLVNNVGAVEEYLGKDYPFYYKNLDEASKKLHDMGIIKATHEYLVEMDKEKLSQDFFINDFKNSGIYKNLPAPVSKL